MATKPEKIIRARGAAERTGLSKTQIKRLERAGKFPGSVPLGDRARGYLESEVDAWIQRRIEERDAASNDGGPGAFGELACGE